MRCRLTDRQTDRQTDTHTHTHGNYRNPRCACASRVNNVQFGGHIITLNLLTSSSDNCVTTVQPQYLQQHLSPLANCIYSCRKKENTLENQGGVQFECNTMHLSTDVHNTGVWLYLNNGGILGTALLAN